MKRKINYKSLTVGLTFILIITALFLFSGCSSNKDSEDEKEIIAIDVAKNENSDQNVQNTEQKIEEIQEETVKELDKDIAQNAEKQTKETELEIEGVCDDYFLQEGDKIKLDNYDIELVKMSRTSVRLKVNDKSLILAEGDRDREEGLSLEIEDNKILYFEDGHKDNSVQIRIGCAKNEKPEDKFVEATLKEAGNDLCKDIYDFCEKEFVAPKSENFNNSEIYDFCGNYSFTQGELKEIGSHEVEVVKIGMGVVNIEFDGNEALLIDEEYKRLDDVGFEITKGNINYFAEDDPDNSVEIRIGCEGGEDSEEQYFEESVYNRGNAICGNLVRQCEQDFDVSVD